MTLFRPCIDLHDGQVKQIVGGTLSDSGEAPQTHFISERDSAWYAKRYREDDCTGGHVIRLGPGNDQAAAAALAAVRSGVSKSLRYLRKNQRISIAAVHDYYMSDPSCFAHHVSSDMNVADMFTKGLAKDAFNRHCRSVGVRVPGEPLRAPDLPGKILQEAITNATA